MKKITMATLAFICCVQFAISQTSQKPQQEITPEDVVRIRTDLVQTDVVVVDKNDQPIKDLKLEDFELYDNGKKQALKVAEFINSQESAPTQQRTASEIKATVESTSAPGLSAKDVKRVVAFVIDDLTIEVEDLTAIRNTLLNFVNNKMQDGDLVAIVRVIGGKGLLQQFTSDRQLLRRFESVLIEQLGRDVTDPRYRHQRGARVPRLVLTVYGVGYRFADDRP